MAKPTTSRAQQPWQEHPMVEELLAELQAIEETPVLPIHAAFRRCKSFLWKLRGFFR